MREIILSNRMFCHLINKYTIILHEISNLETVKSQVIISLFETVRLLVSISTRNLYWLATSRGRIPVVAVCVL